MPNLIDCTSWTVQPYYSTKGSRSKKIVTDASGNQFHFKTSLFKEAKDGKPGRDYKFEFWSEIIAFELGSMLGFNVLRYDIGIFGDQIGCISKSMKVGPNEIVTEGVQYLQGYDPEFAPPQAKRGGKAYSFDLIKNALIKFNLQPHIRSILDILILDAILGNGDRHQENWAFISDHTYLSKRYIQAIRDLKKVIQHPSFWSNIPKWSRWLIRKIYLKGTSQQFRDELLYANFMWNRNLRFAPIYDNGSSLGRELDETAIKVLTEDEEALKKYAFGGESEIHWEKQKLKHFDLLIKVSNEFPEIKTMIKDRCSRYDVDKFKALLNDIDGTVPEHFLSYTISPVRKEFIVNLVTTRISRLKSLFDE